MRRAGEALSRTLIAEQVWDMNFDSDTNVVDVAVRRLRRKVVGTAARPRLAVYLSAKHIYIQFIDDDAGRTLASVSTTSPDARAEKVKPTVAGAARLGQLAAAKAKAAGITAVVFDRGGGRYHGRLKALADAARLGGLTF